MLVEAVPSPVYPTAGLFCGKPIGSAATAFAQKKTYATTELGWSRYPKAGRSNDRLRGVDVHAGASRAGCGSLDLPIARPPCAARFGWYTPCQRMAPDGESITNTRRRRRRRPPPPSAGLFSSRARWHVHLRRESRTSCCPTCLDKIFLAAVTLEKAYRTPKEG